MIPYACPRPQGFIDYLTGPSLDAKILRDNFVFKVVPMLNPDGVVVGNYRCSLAGACRASLACSVTAGPDPASPLLLLLLSAAGTDLNRSWADPSSKLHPTVFHTKQVSACSTATVTAAG